jgi:uncharacterized Zn finger protein (UPF0148 family)
MALPNQQQIVKCPLCGEVTIRQEFGFWKCPACGCEIWPEEEETEEQKKKAIREVYYEEIRTGCWINPKKRSRSNRSRRFGKKKNVVPLWTQRYALF